jgi:hypothetical protein
MGKIVSVAIAPIRVEDIRWDRLAQVDRSSLHITGQRSEWRCRRMTDLELARFVADVVERKILVAQHVLPFEDVGCVFSGLGFLHDVSIEARREIGTCYEYLEQACGETRFGNPHFESVQFIHVEDWLLARDLIAAEVVRRQGGLS